MATSALAELGVEGLTVDLGLPTLVPAILAGSVRSTPPPNGAAAPRSRPQGHGRHSRPGAGARRRAARRCWPGWWPAADRPIARWRTRPLDLPAGGRGGTRPPASRPRRPAPRSAGADSHHRPRGKSRLRISYAASLLLCSPPRRRTSSAAAAAIAPQAGEAATGVTLFMDAVLRALPRPAASRACCCRPTRRRRSPTSCAGAGWIAVAALNDAADPLAEAARLGCSHVLSMAPRPLAAAAGRSRRRLSGMANVAVVGAQWGDEGKGKIVDWLSRARRRRRPLPGRPQRRPHAGHRRHHLQAQPAAVRRRAAGQAVDHRQRRRARSLGAARGDRRAARPGRARRPRQRA